VDYLLVCIVALIASGLTLFSGFGLGTLLLPAFALFFSLPAAIAMTAVVHLANNLFKFAVVGRKANLGVVLRFGITAVPAAWLGAWWLGRLETQAPLFTYSLGGGNHTVTPLGLCIGSLLLFFALFESLPASSGFTFHPRWLPLGGALSGFFGGLSGQQGALRSAFLLRAGLSKEAFIGTGVALACLIDLTRLPAYAGHFGDIGTHAGLVAAAVGSAWAGAFFGARLLHKVTYASVQRLVATLLVALGLLIGAGLI
jgi:uncharacterized membrane protein YfcA